MLRQSPSCFIWQFLLVGLLFIIKQSDARAVNVSNTWTMPQEGLNVFYRFFRDRISWFEADAVCQFHHANLVTVDNSFQFDATRDLLRELDVNDIVWIGLMRPQSSDRFMWSNSRPLVADTGYWAESLPLMDAPLCAVIDPIRDYRWHALRCGGPETASFLCEMPVPSWADACNLKDMPNLTLQYMADTASIELIRNCQEEGLLRTMCRGKQDRERALQDLICPRERLEAQRINDITNSHFKSLQIINSIPSDNNENNDIELLPMDMNYNPHYSPEVQTEKNTVQRLIEQFNVDELMQADEPSNMETVSSFYKISSFIPKPVKKSAKKVLDYPKKDNNKAKSTGMDLDQIKKDKKRLPVEMEDMMMGDQPLQGEPELAEQFLNEEEILEPLPHIKKTNMHKEDGFEKMEMEATAMKKNMQLSKEMEMKKMLTVTTDFTALTDTSPHFTTVSSSTLTPLTTTEAVFTVKQDGSSAVTEHKLQHETHTQLDNTWPHSITTTSPVTIEHPIHPQQPHSNVMTEESQHPHTKESTDNSHFIPPMLMVKSHYVPPNGKHDHHHQQQLHLQHEDSKPHLEATTEEPTETTTIRHKENPISETTIMAVMDTPKVSDLQDTTLKSLEASLSSTAISDKLNTERIQKEDQPEASLAETEIYNSSSLKPITEQHTTETEQSKNFRNLHFQQEQTTMTTNMAHSTASSAANHAEEFNENNNGHEKEKIREGQEELKPAQTSHTDAETTQATKLVATTDTFLKSTEKLYTLETITENAAKVEENKQDKLEKQHKTAREQKLTAIKTTEENKEHLQTSRGTTEKLDATQTLDAITASTSTTTTVSTPATQQLSTAINTEIQNLQQIEKEPMILKEEGKEEELKVEDKQRDQDRKETVVKRTETQATSAATIQAQQQQKQDDNQEEEGEGDEVPATIQTQTPKTIKLTTTTTTSTSTSKTLTTTAKPITTTTLPQTEIKSTETSFLSAGAIITTTTDLSTTSTEDNTSSSTTTTITFTPSPAAAVLANSKVNKNETRGESSTAAANVKMAAATTPLPTPTHKARRQTTTQRPSPPETTRNFLKVSTEMPYKPNRRRTLTKPETVSYMKKILG